MVLTSTAQDDVHVHTIRRCHRIWQYSNNFHVYISLRILSAHQVRLVGSRVRLILLYDEAGCSDSILGI